MKKVMVRPERCVGCMQCMLACAAAHSKSNDLASAILENPLPKPRVHVGAGVFGEGFPNRCRHCDPAPCMQACLPGAIYRHAGTDSVLVDPDRCINCASCAMACPFGVIRYHQDPSSLPGKAVAIKCDNCLARQSKGLTPACVEVCKSGALTFEEFNEALKKRTNEVARSISTKVECGSVSEPIGFSLLNKMKRAQTDISEQ